MATYKAVVLKGGRHLKSDGTSNIKIRIYHNGSTQYIPTRHYIHPEFLNDSGEVVSFAANYEALNYDIISQMQKCREVSIKLGSERLSRMSALDLKDEIIRSIEKKSDVIDFFLFSDSVIKQTKKEKTAEWYSVAVASLRAFVERKSLDARDITTKLLNDYSRYLLEKRIILKNGTIRYHENGTISNYLRALRALFNKLRSEYNNEDFDIIRIPNDPFSKVTIPRYKRKRRSLNASIISKISKTDFSTKRANLARDVFMMQFYMMGINISDLYNLRGEIRGRIEYKRSKVDTVDDKENFVLSIRIEPELRELIDKYSKSGFLSDMRLYYSNRYNFMRAVNVGLKAVSEELNLGVDLSTNWARHSWASIARNQVGISKADIDFCLGHVNNDYKMADIYIDIDYSIYDKTNRAVLDFLKK